MFVASHAIQQMADTFVFLKYVNHQITKYSNDSQSTLAELFGGFSGPQIYYKGKTLGSYPVDSAIHRINHYPEDNKGFC